MIIVFTSLALAHIPRFDPPFKSFVWSDRIVADYETFAGIAASVTNHDTAGALLGAVLRRGNGPEVFGAVLDRFDDPAAADRYAELFEISHPIFGSVHEMRVMTAEHRKQLMRLVARGVPSQEVARLRLLAPALRYHGVKYLRKAIDSATDEQLGSAEHWASQMFFAQQSCDGYLADSRRQLKLLKHIIQTKLAFDLLIDRDRRLERPHDTLFNDSALWTVGNKVELYAEYSKYPGEFLKYEQQARAFTRRTRGPGWRRLIRRRSAELRIRYLEMAQERTRARLEFAKKFHDAAANAYNSTRAVRWFRLEKMSLFNEAQHRDAAVDAEITEELSRLRRLHEDLTFAVRPAAAAAI